MPSPYAYMGYPPSPYTDMGCTCIYTCIRTLHYDYYPTYIGLQSLGVTEPMFTHRLYTTSQHYVYMHTPPSFYMGTCLPSFSHMGYSSVCVSPPHLLPLQGSKLGGTLLRLARWTSDVLKAHLAIHVHPTFVPTILVAALGPAATQAAGSPQRAHPFRYMYKPG
jgi:hypothetical protein